tara:strand:- start:2648 stop:3535 length:888 start_codon:yes stop_codon:yes gene_type:complete
MTDLKIIKQIKLIRNLTDDNFENIDLTEDYFYKSDEDGLFEIGLERPISIQGIDQILRDAVDTQQVRDFWKIKDITPRHLDGFIGIKLHHMLRITLAEASRPELWNSIIFDSKAAKNYIRHRVNFGLTEKTRDLRKSDLFLQNANEVHNLNRIAGSWWATELTRNGSNYSSSKNAFLCSTFFTDRYMNMNFIHYRQFGIGMANYFYNNDNARDLLATNDQLGNPQFSATLNDYLISVNVEKQFENINIDFENFQKWQVAKRKENIITDGPNDFKVSDNELLKVKNLFDKLIKQRK